MINPIVHEGLMKTDINYAKKHMQLEIDFWKAAFYEACRVLGHPAEAGYYDSKEEAASDIMGYIMDDNHCGP